MRAPAPRHRAGWHAPRFAASPLHASRSSCFQQSPCNGNRPACHPAGRRHSSRVATAGTARLFCTLPLMQRTANRSQSLDRCRAMRQGHSGPDCVCGPSPRQTHGSFRRKCLRSISRTTGRRPGSPGGASLETDNRNSHPREATAGLESNVMISQGEVAESLFKRLSACKIPRSWGDGRVRPMPLPATPGIRPA